MGPFSKKKLFNEKKTDDSFFSRRSHFSAPFSAHFSVQLGRIREPVNERREKYTLGSVGADESAHGPKIVSTGLSSKRFETNSSFGAGSGAPMSARGGMSVGR